MRVSIQLKQHIGAPCKVITKIGDQVEKGQLVAIPDGLGANIHASVSGEVVDITSSEIIIEMNSVQPENYIPIPETKSMLEAVKEAGIVGAGGAGFPTYVKYGTKVEGGYIIANAAECEPLLAHNVRLLEEQPEVIIRGLKYLMEISSARKAYIAIKGTYRKAVLAIEKVCKKEANIEVKLLPDMYPVGDERIVIRELLGVALKPGQPPIDANVIVSNVETIKHVVEAIERRKPCIEKDITVSGRVSSGTKVFENQPIGMPVSHYIEVCDGYS